MDGFANQQALLQALAAQAAQLGDLGGLNGEQALGAQGVKRKLEEAQAAFAAAAVQAQPALQDQQPAAAAAQSQSGSKITKLSVKFAGNPPAASESLYISGLPASVDEDALNNLFAAQGFTVARSKVFPDTRGAGITTAMMSLTSVEQAAMAIKTFDGQQAVYEVPGATVPVSALAATAQQQRPVAQQQPPATTRKAPGNLQVRYAGDGTQQKETVYITGVPSSIEVGHLKALFQMQGLNFTWGKVTPDSKGLGVTTAMATLGSLDDAARAIANLNDQFVDFNCIEAVAHEQLSAAPPFGVGASHPGGPRKSSTLMVKFAGMEMAPSPNVYISGIPPVVTPSLLREMIKGQGFTVHQVKILPDTKGAGLHSAMVALPSAEEGARVIEVFNNQTLQLEGLAEAAQALKEKEEMEGIPPPEPEKKRRKGPVLLARYAGSDAQPSSNMYLSGLPTSVDPMAIGTMLVTDVGISPQQIKILPDVKGVGLCAAMVQFLSVEECTQAISVLDGQQVEASEGAPGGAWGKGKPGKGCWGKGGGKGKPSPESILNVKYAGQMEMPSENLVVKGLPSIITESAIRQLFQSQECTVQRCKVLSDGAAMVQLGSPKEASYCINHLNGQAVVFEGLEQAAAEEAAQSWNSWGSDSWGSDYGGDWGAPSWGASWGGKDGKGGKDSFGKDGKGGKWGKGGKGGGDGWNNSAAWAPAAPSDCLLKVRYAGADQSPKDKIYISGLPSGIDPNALKDLFGSMGMTMNWAKVQPDTKGIGVTSAVAELSSVEDAMTAVSNLNDKQVTFDPSSIQPFKTAVAPERKRAVLQVKYAGQDMTPSPNLYVSGLPNGIDRAALEGMFGNAGFTVCNVKMLPDTKFAGLSSAMVGLASQEEAALAIESFNQQEIRLDEGKPASSEPCKLIVKYAGVGEAPSENLYVAGLPADIDEGVLRQMFVDLGMTVNRIKLLAAKFDGAKMAAMVQVGSAEEADYAINSLNGQTVQLGGQGMSQGANKEELMMQVEMLLQDSGVDENCANDLRGCPPDVIQLVVAQGSLEGTSNPSGALIGRIRRAREQCGGY